MKINSSRICIAALAMLLLVLPGSSCIKQKRRQDHVSRKGEMTITGSFAMYPLVARWASEYTVLHAGVRIHVWPGSSKKGEIIAMNGLADMGMYSMRRDSSVVLNVWFLPVAREPVLPVYNAGHPDDSLLRSAGMAQDKFRLVWLHGKDTPEGPGPNFPLRDFQCYTRVDVSGAAQVWAAWLGMDQADLRGLPVYGDPGMVEGVGRDLLGTGYCNLKYVYDTKTGMPMGAIRPLPVDIDGSGRIDGREDMYCCLDTFSQGVRDGRYPPGLVRDLYLVFPHAPDNDLVLDFLHWVLTGGQDLIADLGYFPLEPGRMEEALTTIHNLKIQYNETRTD